jgi:hypothetical protein
LSGIVDAVEAFKVSVGLFAVHCWFTGCLREVCCILCN